MTIRELVEYMDRVERDSHELGLKGPITVALVVRRESPPRGRTVMLFGSCGPRGEVLCCKDTPDGAFDVVGRFDVQKVRAYLKKQLDP